jgi:hypothetical protein
MPSQRRNKSLFASFSLEKEESSFFEKKEAKRLLFSASHRPSENQGRSRNAGL